MLAHIAGIPVEETALSLAPVATVASALAALRLRQLARRLYPYQGRVANRPAAGGTR
jgi:hypothetical protein